MLTVRKQTPKEILNSEVATDEAWAELRVDRSPAQINAEAAAAYKTFRAENRSERTAHTKGYNTALRKLGICPKKFNAAVRNNYGLNPDEFLKLVTTTCRTDK